jgi:predicted outer membrane repeat protein
MRTFICFIMMIVAASCLPLQSAVINVPLDQPTIQAGINAAVNGDTVLVADGTYTSDGNRDIDYGGRNIVVKSVNGPQYTIIDCQGTQWENHRAFIFQNLESTDAILEGFKIQGGYKDIADGIYLTNSSSVTIKNCIFQMNRKTDIRADSFSSLVISGCSLIGNPTTLWSIHSTSSNVQIRNCDFINQSHAEAAIMSFTDSSVIIEDCTFNQNGSAIAIYGSIASIARCSFSGSTGYLKNGALYCIEYGPGSPAAVTVADCVFENNLTNAMYIDFHSFGTITECDFLDNEGAGLVCAYGGSATVTNSLFERNSGRAIFCHQSSPTIDSCEIIGNSLSPGGGIYCVENSAPSFANCVFSNNITTGSGGAVYCDGSSSPTFTNCTFYGNSAPVGGCFALLSGSSPTLENCIISFGYQGEAMLGGSPSLACCDIYGNAGGDWVGYISSQLGINGNFSANPLFCDTAHGMFNLSEASPCLPENNSCEVLIGALGDGCTSFYNFSLIQPVSDSVYLQTPPEFIWHKTEIAGTGTPASYILYIDDNLAFASPDSFATYGDTAHSYSGVLPRSVKYFWRVKAYDATADPLFSNETWNFYIDGYPTLPAIFSPANNTIANASTYFVWLACTDPDPLDVVTYTLQMDNSSSFTSPEIDISGITNEGTIQDQAVAIRLGDLPGYENLQQGQVFFWRVRSDDKYGLHSNFTDGSNYFVMGQPGGTYEYLPGDVNMYNGIWTPVVVGADATYLINYFRSFETSLPCNLDGFWASADANGDCSIIGSDVTRLVNYFRGVGIIEYCPSYPPAWLTPAELPGEAPPGWPNCE